MPGAAPLIAGVRSLVVPLLRNNHGKVVHNLCHQAVQFDGGGVTSSAVVEKPCDVKKLAQVNSLLMRPLIAAVGDTVVGLVVVPVCNN